jgi:hypothetical protein
VSSSQGSEVEQELDENDKQAVSSVRACHTKQSMTGSSRKRAHKAGFCAAA